MTSREMSTSEKLRIFAASPNSSQDFDVSDSKIDTSVSSAVRVLREHIITIGGGVWYLSKPEIS